MDRALDPAFTQRRRQTRTALAILLLAGMFVREVLMRHGFAYSLAATGQGETRFEIRFPNAQ